MGGHVALLHVRILAAYNLWNRDSGLFGDKSDSYVLARIGQAVRRTPTIDNNLNPVWTTRNEYAFGVVAQDGELELEVLNANVIREDDTLGKASMAFWTLPTGQWIKRVEQLTGAPTGELEFEVYVEPSRAQQGMAP